MKLKRTIAVAMKKDESMIVPDGELWVGYMDKHMVLETSANKNHFGYNEPLASLYGDKVSGDTNKFYGTPKGIVKCKGNNASGDPTYAFTCLVFDISKEVNNV